MKKTIKLLSIVLALAMFLCGCESSDNQKGVEKPESSTSISNNAKEETEQATTEQMSDTELDNLRKKFADNVGNFVDLKLYENNSDSDSEDLSYELLEEKEYTFNNTIAIDGKEPISFPISYSDLEKMGWQISERHSSEMIEGVSGSYMTFFHGLNVPLYNENEKHANFGLYNTEKNDINVKDCYAYDVAVYTKYSEMNSGLNSSGVMDFEISNGLTQESSMSDVISVLGNPKEIEYDFDDFEVKLKYGATRFFFNYATEKMTMCDYGTKAGK